MSRKQELKAGMEAKAAELSKLSESDKALLLAWLDSVEKYVHMTLHGNYSNGFNDLRKRLHNTDRG